MGCFNEAALKRGRKLAILTLCAPPHSMASMRPPSSEGGNRVGIASRLRRVRRFNEAALKRGRKPRLAKDAADKTDKLQ